MIQPAARRPPAILVVDDDEDDAELVVRALRRCGILGDIARAYDGVEALEAIFGTADEADGTVELCLPGIVFLDVNMPRCSGLEVLRRIRGDPRTHELPVVILTHSDEERTAVESWGLGANGFVKKSASFHGLVDSFRELRQVGLRWLIVEGRAPAGRGKPA